MDQSNASITNFLKVDNGGVARKRSLVKRNPGSLPFTANGKNGSNNPNNANNANTSSPPRRKLLTDPSSEDDPSSDNWNWKTPWRIFVAGVTIWLPRTVLAWMGKGEAHVAQAFKEKVALCIIIFIMCVAIAFLTVGLQRTICPPNSSANGGTLFSRIGTDQVAIGGKVFSLSSVNGALSSGAPANNTNFLKTGADNTRFFPPAGNPCSTFGLNLCTQGLNNSCFNRDKIDNLTPTSSRVVYEWADLNPNSFVVFDGNVIDFAAINTLLASTSGGTKSTLDPAILAALKRKAGGDVTLALRPLNGGLDFGKNCMSTAFKVGELGSASAGCTANTIFMIVSLATIFGVIFTKFFMALAFSWFISKKYDRNSAANKRARAASAATAASSPTSLSNFHPNASKLTLPTSSRFSTVLPSSTNLVAVPEQQQQPMTFMENDDPYVILLVTCYSEGAEGIKNTLDSLSQTDYPDHKKMLFIVADGLIMGEGNSKTTPEIILDMLELDQGTFAGVPEPASYIAVAAGPKQHNKAQVYVGHYRSGKHRVPVVMVVKCGTAEEKNGPKPGNRGKRDSQIILMRFFQRVLFDERLTELDYDLFRKITYLTRGATPDKFEIVLMVDADTRVMEDSLGHMVSAMKQDPYIMGLCGETRIDNKSDSWVTAIQVFEYYINHHLGKAFESVIGGVTCLPGCFCMYRIKAPKNGLWVPILANPEVIAEYSQDRVQTLHQKNLLLLGEDRFLTTLMLKTFPNRKQVFVPQAVCKTVVPDTFKVLLSQRRRWINSTIHNLLELVLVRELCGIFCFSMQFVIMLELIGTVTLPAAVCLTYFLIFSSMFGFVQLLPLLLLAGVLGLPAILILLTTRKAVYVAWMFVYLLSLPVWNFILPVYAFWHFDDFGWGQTRKVEGEKEDKDGHGGGGSNANAKPSEKIVLKKWSDWEKGNNHAAGSGSGKGTPFRVESSQNLNALLAVPDQREQARVSLLAKMEALQIQQEAALTGQSSSNLFALNVAPPPPTAAPYLHRTDSSITNVTDPGIESSNSVFFSSSNSSSNNPSRSRIELSNRISMLRKQQLPNVIVEGESENNNQGHLLD